jgi:serine/threonine-protein kinase GIN4
VPVPPIINLSPIEGSPPSPPYSPATRENVVSLNTINGTMIRKPLAGITAGIGMRDNLPPAPLLPKPSLNDLGGKRKARVLSDLTGPSRNTENANGGRKEKEKRDRVKERVREWEREKERLREMERLDEIEKERDEEVEQERERVGRRERADVRRSKERDKEDHDAIASTTVPPASAIATSSSSGE